MNLYLVRHGETTFNKSHRIQGQLDSELSALGRRQCEAVAEALGGVPCDAVISSPLRRAQETAQYLADKLKLELSFEPRLMEINAGIFQGHSWHELDEKFPQEAARWKSHDPDYQIPGGESRRQLMIRTGDAFRAIREAGYAHVIVVAHGGSLSAALKSLLGVPAERSPFELRNGSICRIEWNKEFKLLTLNETAHLHGLESAGGDL
jgi:broad specificity phosphatase PhoE